MKKQTEIPGTEPPRIDAIETIATKYVAVRDDRIALNKEEKKAKAELEAVLAEHADELDEHAKGGVCYTMYDGERQLECRYEKSVTVNVSVRVKQIEEDEAGEVIDIDSEKLAG